MSITRAYQGTHYGNKPTTTTTSIIRPEDAIAYAAGDVIAPADVEFKSLVFKNAFNEPGSAYLFYAQMQVFSDQVTKLDADLLLFDKTLTSVFVDNAPLITGTSISKLEWEGFIGAVSFAGVDAETTYGHCIYELNPSKIISSGSDDLYGLLVAKNAYTPISAEEIILKMSIMPRLVA